MANPEVLVSADSFTLKDGRVVYTFTAIPHLDPRTLMHQRVQVDGRMAMVHGVETFAIIDATGTSFGLLLEFDHDS